MIVITGGAGFIGSRLVMGLNRRGVSDILVVDHLGTTEKWKNLVPLSFADYLDREAFIEKLEAGAFGGAIEAILHLGACSSTTESDSGYLMENNYRYTLRLAEWRDRHRACRMIYASSAATYGGGEQGYADDEDAIDRLRPLNMYGYSKQLFDLVARRRGWLRSLVGLKYFNVYGPHEDHKGDMRSLINKAWPQVLGEGVMRLFRSHRPDYGDGAQRRDFIHVDDAVAMTLFFLDRPEIGGLFNVGTGKARTWNALAKAVFSAAGKEPVIEYIDMPPVLRGKYQYFTEAKMDKIRAAGCGHVCMSLEEGVRRYAEHLAGQGA